MCAIRIRHIRLTRASLFSPVQKTQNLNRKVCLFLFLFFYKWLVTAFPYYQLEAFFKWDTSVTGTIFPEAWISSFCLCLIRSYVSPTSNAHPTHIYTDMFHTHTDVFHTWPSSLTPLAETDMIGFLHSALLRLFKTLSRRAKGGGLSCVYLGLFLGVVCQGVSSRWT